MKSSDSAICQNINFFDLLLNSFHWALELQNCNYFVRTGQSIVSLFSADRFNLTHFFLHFFPATQNVIFIIITSALTFEFVFDVRRLYFYQIFCFLHNRVIKLNKFIRKYFQPWKNSEIRNYLQSVHTKENNIYIKIIVEQYY